MVARVWQTDAPLKVKLLSLTGVWTNHNWSKIYSTFITTHSSSFLLVLFRVVVCWSQSQLLMGEGRKTVCRSITGPPYIDNHTYSHSHQFTSHACFWTMHTLGEHANFIYKGPKLVFKPCEARALITAPLSGHYFNCSFLNFIYLYQDYNLMPIFFWGLLKQTYWKSVLLESFRMTLVWYNSSNFWEVFKVRLECWLYKHVANLKRSSIIALKMQWLKPRRIKKHRLRRHKLQIFRGKSCKSSNCQEEFWTKPPKKLKIIH